MPYAKSQDLRDRVIALRDEDHAVEQYRPDVAERRRQWKREAPRRDAGPLIFIDEILQGAGQDPECPSNLIQFLVP